MKRVNVRLEIEEERRDIDVLFSASERDEQVESLMSRIDDPLSGNLTAYGMEGKTVSLPEERIISASADNKRLKVVADDGLYWVRMSVQEAERALNPSHFLRISRYEIINLAKVTRFDFSVSGTLRVAMEGGYETWASRRFIPEIKKRLQS